MPNLLGHLAETGHMRSVDSSSKEALVPDSSSKEALVLDSSSKENLHMQPLPEPIRTLCTLLHPMPGWSKPYTLASKPQLRRPVHLYRIWPPQARKYWSAMAFDPPFWESPVPGGANCSGCGMPSKKDELITAIRDCSCVCVCVCVRAVRACVRACVSRRHR